MYYYILDPKGIDPEKFERTTVVLSGLLAEFGISGEMARVTPLRRINDLVEAASSRGVRTLVVCGSDDTFNQVLAALKGKTFVLAFIPFVEHSSLGRIFGTSDLMSSVKAIASRRVESIDLARVGSLFFLSFLEFGFMSSLPQKINFWNFFKVLSEPKVNLTIRIDDQYNLTVSCMGGLVVNARSGSSSSQQIANPTDGYLDLMIIEDMSKSTLLKHHSALANQRLEDVPGTTVIRCQRVDVLRPEKMPLTMLGRIVAKAPIPIDLKSSQLKMIVGRDRAF